MLCAVCECCMQVEVCSLYSSEVSHVTVNVCVLATSANVTEHELQQQRHLLGTAAVMFVISLSDADLLSMQVSLVISLSDADLLSMQVSLVIVINICNTATDKEQLRQETLHKMWNK